MLSTLNSLTNKSIKEFFSRSAQTQNEIDARVVALVKAEHEKARKLLEENRTLLDKLSAFLYEKETITGDEFMQIVNENKEAKA